MFTIEQKRRDWIVANDGATVSAHPNRREAERAVEWLVEHSAVGPKQAVLYGDLTARELDVLQRLNYRGSYTEMAREMCLSTNTIKTHVKHVYAKLGVADRGSALAAATLLGLLDGATEARDDGETDMDGRMALTATAARTYLAAFADVLSTHDWTSYARVLRVDVRQIAPLMTCDGIEAIIEFNQRVIAAIPDIRIEARHVTIDPDVNRAIFECLHSGTIAGELSTPYGVIPATGKRFQFTSMHVVTFDESGLASEIRRYWDLYEVLRDQGLASL